MRPPSIVMFERLFLASLAISAISTVIVYDGVVRALANDASMQRLGLAWNVVAITPERQQQRLA